MIGVRPDASCARTTAMSLLGSVPTTVNVVVRPSANVTFVWAPPGPPGVSLAAATTWLFVRIRPSEDRMMPEPSSDCRPRSTSNLTTLGTTLAATCSTEPAGRLAAGTLGATPVTLELAEGRSGCTSSATPPPMPAETTATATAPAVKAPARERFWANWRDRHAGRLLRGAAVRVVGRPKRLCLLRLLGRVAPVVRLLLLVRTGRCAPGYPGAACCGWPPGRRPGCGGGGVYLGWFVMSLRCSSWSRFRHLEQRRMQAQGAHLG